MLGQLIAGEPLIICDGCGISTRYYNDKHVFIQFNENVHICEDCLNKAVDFIDAIKKPRE